MRLFERRASREARVYAEAQALLDDGLGVGEVLDQYPGDASWLAPMLEIGSSVSESYRPMEPDPEFSASLRQAFLAAARRPSFIATSEPSPNWLRTAVASATVAAAVAGLGVLMFGLVTAEQAVPGDWNYTLKITRERIEDAFASGDQQVDVQIRQTEARVFELQRLSDRGRPLSAGDLQKLDREARELVEITQGRPLDQAQLTRLKALFESAALVLEDIGEQQPELADAVATTRQAVDNAVAATGVGSVTAIAEPSSTAEPEPTDEPTETPEATPTDVPEATPTATGTEAPPDTATPEQTAAPTTVSSASNSDSDPPPGD